MAVCTPRQGAHNAQALGIDHAGLQDVRLSGDIDIFPTSPTATATTSFILDGEKFKTIRGPLI
jgi:hypothetical protein